jgi:hypothetical protein
VHDGDVCGDGGQLQILLTIIHLAGGADYEGHRDRASPANLRRLRGDLERNGATGSLTCHDGVRPAKGRHHVRPNVRATTLGPGSRRLLGRVRPLYRDDLIDPAAKSQLSLGLNGSRREFATARNYLNRCQLIETYKGLGRKTKIYSKRGAIS